MRPTGSALIARLPASAGAPLSGCVIGGCVIGGCVIGGATLAQSATDPAQAAESGPLRAVLDRISARVSLHAADGSCMLLNRASFPDGAGYVGRMPEEIGALPANPGIQKQVHDAFVRAKAGETVRELLTMVTADGALRCVDLRLTPIVENGTVMLIVSETRDVTVQHETEQALRENTRRLRETFDHALIGVAVIRIDGVFAAVNSVLASMSGYRPDEMVGRMQLSKLCPLGDAPAPDTSPPGPLNRELHWIARDGRRFEVLIDARPVADENGNLLYSILQVQDVSALKQSQRRLSQERELAQITLAAIADGVIRTDAAGIVTYSNVAAQRMLKLPESAIHGHPIAEVVQLLSQGTLAPLPCPIGAVLDEGPAPSILALLKTQDGRHVPVEGAVAAVRGRSGERLGSVFVLHDMTQTHALTTELHYQARHDSLTGLPNRRAFELELASRLQSTRGGGSVQALLYLDLDRFKLVNDACGHGAGDLMLRQIAAELRSRLRSEDLLARIGGDEFAVILGHAPAERALHGAAELVEVLERFRFQYAGQAFQAGVSIGAVLLDEHVRDIDQALSEADMACYVAKSRGRSRVQLYERGDSELLRVEREMGWATRISQALDEDRIELHAQRIVPIGSSGRNSYEVLLRKRSEDGRLILPSTFLPAAERFGLMDRIERSVIQQALQRITELCNSPRANDFGYLSINLSGSSLSDPKFVAFLREQLAHHRTPPDRVRFEITESAALQGVNNVREWLAALRNNGYRILLDDFGTGFTSFEYLKTLQIDGIKIDQSFTRGLADDGINQTIVEAICRIGKQLGLEIIAEGVEDAVSLAALRRLGVQYAQGWLFHRAEPLDLALPATTEISRRAVGSGSD